MKFLFVADNALVYVVDIYNGMGITIGLEQLAISCFVHLLDRQWKLLFFSASCIVCCFCCIILDAWLTRIWLKTCQSKFNLYLFLYFKREGKKKNREAWLSFLWPYKAICANSLSKHLFAFRPRITWSLFFPIIFSV